MGLLGVALSVFAVSPASADNQQVQVTDNRFTAARVAVKVGESVTWDHPATSDRHNVRFEDNGQRFPGDPSPSPWTGTRTFSAEATYRYYCEQHGGPGGSGMSGVVYVNATGTVPPTAPSASFVVLPGVARVGQLVGFDATGTSDPNYAIAKYEWDLDGNGSYETDTGTTPTTSLTYAAAGLRSVKLRVTNGPGLTSETTRRLAVTNEPVASFTASPNPVQTGETVSLDGSSSSDPDGRIAKYEWDLDGDGSYETDTGSTPTTSRTYSSPAALTVRLRVTDDLGISSDATQALQVTAAPAATPAPTPTPPVASDATAPAAKLSGRRTQKLAATLIVGVTCLDEACRATSSANVQVPRVGPTRARTYALGKVTTRIAAGATARVELKLSAPARAAIRRGLKARRKVGVKLRVSVADAAGNARTLTRTIRLRP